MYIKLLNARLCEEIELNEPLTLEVSSAGLDHPLKLNRQYVKNIGKLSFNFLLPENASDAFLFDNSYPAKYSKNQKHGQFKINPGKELVVNLERPQNAKTISYTNSQIKHFSSDELMEEVFVCAKI